MRRKETASATSGAPKAKRAKLAAPRAQCGLPDLTATPTQVFEWLLGGRAQAFFADVWEKKPLHVKRRDAHYYSGLFSHHVFKSALSTNADQFKYGFNLNLCVCENGRKIDKNPRAAGPPAAGSASESSEDEEDDQSESDSRPSYAPVTVQAVQQLYREGCTVQVLHPQHYSEPVWRLNSALESVFGCLVGANVYITPPESQGLAPHHDDVDVFIIQVSGSKAWKLYNPVLELPRDHSGDFASDEIGLPMLEVELQQGDMLYFPRGVVHEARASSAESVHVTISTYQRTAWVDLLAAALPRALENACARDVDFRRGLPVNFPAYMGTQFTQGAQPTGPAAGAGAGRRGGEQKQAERGGGGGEGGGEDDSGAESGDHEDVSWEVLGCEAGPGGPPALSSPEQAHFARICKTLIRKLPDYVDLHAAADAVSSDLWANRLPPYKPEPMGPTPSSGDHLIRLLSSTSVRLVLDADEAGEAKATVICTRSNSREHHLDGRFPSSAETIRFPASYAPALAHLFAAVARGEFIRVAELAPALLSAGGSRPAGQASDDEEEEEEEDSERDEHEHKAAALALISSDPAELLITACVELAQALWACGALVVRPPAALTAKPTASKPAKLGKRGKVKAGKAGESKPSVAEPATTALPALAICDINQPMGVPTFNFDFGTTPFPALQPPAKPKGKKQSKKKN